MVVRRGTKDRHKNEDLRKKPSKMLLLKKYFFKPRSEPSTCEQLNLH